MAHPTGAGKSKKKISFCNPVSTATSLDRDEDDDVNELDDVVYCEGLCVPMDRLEDLEFFPNFSDELISLAQLLPEDDELLSSDCVGSGRKTKKSLSKGRYDELDNKEFSRDGNVESGGGTLKDHDEISQESLSDIEFSQDGLEELRPQDSLSDIEFSRDGLEELRPHASLYDQKLHGKLGLGAGCDTKLFGNNFVEEDASFSNEGQISSSDLLEQSWCMDITKPQNKSRDCKNEDSDIGDGEISSIFKKPRSKNVKMKNVKREFPTFSNPRSKNITKNSSMKKANSSSNPRNMKRSCSHCQAEKTPQWRVGPNGPHTLCNACGVRYAAGRLLPEYRPAASPSFDSNKHSNFHKRIVQKKKNSRIDKFRYSHVQNA